MRNAVRFQSSLFNTTEAKDYFINDFCFGDDLAVFLCEKLRERGISAVEPWQEDWGWQFEAENCLVSVGFNSDEWQIYFEPIRSFFQKLFNEEIDISKITKSSHQILKDELEIHEIKWFESTKSGQEIDFGSEP